jgi:hypothetical protein
MHDRPTAAELVSAVREFLERDVFPSVEGRVQFHTRVAMNALAMVERELELGTAQSAQHERDLVSLGVADEAELASAIRTGALDDRMDEVRGAVRRTVRAKLEVANPKYLEA